MQMHFFFRPVGNAVNLITVLIYKTKNNKLGGRGSFQLWGDAWVPVKRSVTEKFCFQLNTSIREKI